MLERGGGFAIDAADETADARERALLAEWGFTAVTAAAALAPDGTAWLIELFSDARTHALPAALPELRLLAGEAAGRGPAPGYDAPVTSRAKVSKTSTSVSTAYRACTCDRQTPLALARSRSALPKARCRSTSSRAPRRRSRRRRRRSPVGHQHVVGRACRDIDAVGSDPALPLTMLSLMRLPLNPDAQAA